MNILSADRRGNKRTHCLKSTWTNYDFKSRRRWMNEIHYVMAFNSITYSHQMVCGVWAHVLRYCVIVSNTKTLSGSLEWLNGTSLFVVNDLGAHISEFSSINGARSPVERALCVHSVFIWISILFIRFLRCTCASVQWACAHSMPSV